MQQKIPDLKGKIALVTGASRGIGYACALGLAKAGAHIVALARTTGGLQELDDEIFAATGARATLVPADIADYDGIDRLGAALNERYDHLDILVANAAQLHPLSPLGHIRPKDFEKIMAVNVTANYRLIRAMDPLLRAAPRAAAVFITDSVAHKAEAFWGPYAASKAALETLAKVYAAETAHTRVTVSLADPGPTNTKLRRQAFPGTSGEKKPDETILFQHLDQIFQNVMIDSDKTYG